MRKLQKFFGRMGVLTLITIMGCTTNTTLDNNPFFKPFYGDASWVLNGISYDVAPYAYTSNWNDTTFSLVLDRLDENLFLQSELVISNVPVIVGHFPVIVGTGATNEGPGALFSTSLSQGCVTGDLFRYNSMLSYSHIQLEKYDNINQEIAGSFNLQLVRSTEYIASPELPDTLNIHGTFLTRIDYN